MIDLCDASISRRRLLGSAGALFAWSFAPRFAHAAGARDSRFVCVVLRGALDGLSAVPALGDPDYAGLRTGIALSREGPAAALPLDGFFYLHPAMPNLARLYKAGQASVIHAVATSYRSRSHFDGLDMLESGQPAPGRVGSGWLNRLVAALPAGEPIGRAGALGVGATPPLIVRGPAAVTGWAPQTLPRADDDLIERVADLYAERDPVLAQALFRSVQLDRAAGAGGNPIKGGGPNTPAGKRAVAEGAARLIASENGPRIAAIALDGWDTHAAEGGATGRLAGLLAGLDATLAGFEAGLAPRWRDTVVMVVTEFGRTARVNGTVGTDHGTATVAFLVGGAVKGGRVIADWPGLTAAALHEGRDLRPTADLRAVAKGILADLFGVPAGILGRDVFPDSGGVKPMPGLLLA